MTRPSAAARLAAPALLALLALPACDREGDTFILVRVNLRYRAVEGQVTTLRATVEDGTRNAMRDFSRPSQGLIAFPTSFTIELGRQVVGPVKIDVRALNAARMTLAQGAADVSLKIGQTNESELWLDCFGVCAADGGSDGPLAAVDVAASDLPPGCGNGRIDPTETCDIAIPVGRPGACPPLTCDDGLACTVDVKTGSGCAVRCGHIEITTFMAGDGCCPANSNNGLDPDCSATCGNGRIDSGETCDSRIAAGRPGVCPVADDCVDRDFCTTDVHISAHTCSARCVHSVITEFIAGDRCCPSGASNQSDPDCPVVCGNGVKEAGELCDPGIKAPGPGACPATCVDNDPCTINTRDGAGCQATCKFVPMRDFINGDTCCPQGGNRNIDSDCRAVCGNGVVEAGELCDRSMAAGTPGACLTECPVDSTGCLPARIEGSAESCNVRCQTVPITTCSKNTKDGCCPANCNAVATSPGHDVDCSATCGNGTVEPGELCDTATAQGGRGACPLVCNDGVSCTSDLLVSPGTCSAQCQFPAIVTVRAGDGCCPPGANNNLDSDCPPVCGNGVVEAARETCDRSIAAGIPGACPVTCPAPMVCMRFTFGGAADACTARCASALVTSCVGGDGCCPASCHAGNDADCPAVCGNGVLESGEACDRGITAGNPDACPASCDDGNSCTTDAASGRVEDCTRRCTSNPVLACATGDGCCPAGCAPDSDKDCAATCGNGVLETRETCDPPSNCPTMCPDDGDPCTQEKLTGAANRCTAACSAMPIMACTRISDRCCPTGCDRTSDADCPAGGS